MERKEQIQERIQRMEKQASNQDGQKYRLQVHLMPPVGWLNDPNGLCEWKGWYHVFFQYSPEDVRGGKKYWGHYKSKDFCSWQYEGAAIVCDTEWDRDGAYSGSAFTEDGVMELFYTGNCKEEGDFDYIFAGRKANVLYTESADGLGFSEKRRLLANADYPAGYTCHVRDPKVWKQDETYYMVLGGRRIKEGTLPETGGSKTEEMPETKGAVLLYSSKDKQSWSFQQELSTTEEFGYMWECPDLIWLEGHCLLLCCPQGLESRPDCFQNMYQSGYFICEDYSSEKKEYQCRPENFIELDYGFDFYAPQTFLDSRGRRILIGWAGMVDDTSYDNAPMMAEGWQHGLTIPRQLMWKNHRIYQWPVEEWNRLREESCCFEGQTGKVEGKAFDMELCFEKTLEHEEQGIRFGEDLEITCQNRQVSLRHLSEAGRGRGLRTAMLPEGEDGLQSLRVIKDASMVEIYVNGGALVFTTYYYPQAVEYTVAAITGNIKSLEIWKLKKMEII